MGSSYVNRVEFGRLVRTHRLRLGLSQTQLAALVGIGRPHISKIERGLEPASSSLTKRLEMVFDASGQLLEASGRCPTCKQWPVDPSRMKALG